MAESSAPTSGSSAEDATCSAVSCGTSDASTSADGTTPSSISSSRSETKPSRRVRSTDAGSGVPAGTTSVASLSEIAAEAAEKSVRPTSPRSCATRSATTTATSACRGREAATACRARRSSDRLLPGMPRFASIRDRTCFTRPGGHVPCPSITCRSASIRIGRFSPGRRYLRQWVCCCDARS